MVRLKCPNCPATFEDVMWGKSIPTGTCPLCNYAGSERQFRPAKYGENMRLHNIKGCIIADLGKIKTNVEGFKVSGLLLPKDEISRNGILYDWDSVKAKAKEFEGVPMNYNHIIDDDKKPIGKIIKTWVKETEDSEGPAGMYYEADIDEGSEYADSIKKGYLNKVSLQVTADAQKEEAGDDGNYYTRAWIGDPLEVSVVKVPGFKQTTMEVALAEAFKGIQAKEDVGHNFDKLSTFLYSKPYGDLGPIQQTKIRKLIYKDPTLEMIEEDSGDFKKEDMTMSTNPGATQVKVAKKESFVCDGCHRSITGKANKTSDKQTLCDKCYDEWSLDNMDFNEMIKHEGNSWNVYTKDGSKLLGKHNTEEDAKKQLAAIETSKHSEMLSIGDFTYVNGKSTQVIDFAIEKDKNLVQYWGVDSDKKKVSWSGKYSEAFKELQYTNRDIDDALKWHKTGSSIRQIKDTFASYGKNFDDSDIEDMLAYGESFKETSSLSGSDIREYLLKYKEGKMSLNDAVYAILMEVKQHKESFLREDRTKSFTYDELISEHERLVDALKSKDPQKLDAELEEQSKELEEYKAGAGEIDEDSAKELADELGLK